MSTNLGTTHVVTYVPGAKGAPSFCRIYKFPNFEENQVVTNKSFYQADTVDLKWNGPGTAVLILTQVPVTLQSNKMYFQPTKHRHKLI
jgi:translation initiation factor 2A